MVALAGSIATVATVPFFHAMGIWVVVLEGHFMWSRIHWAAAVFISQVFTLLVPVVGYLTDRYGPRRLVLPGLFIITVGFVSFGLIQSLGTYYASIIILVIGMNLLLLIASPFAGWMFHQYGSYDRAFLILAGLNLVGAVCFILASLPCPRPPAPVQAAPAIK